ncbi:MAG: hypothetical protein ACXVCM_12155, partial [Ktedonobacteraceae bacterium]
MAKNLPTVTGKTLIYQRQGHEQVVLVGTPAWYAWLQHERAFSFRTSSRQFTARKEQASNRRGGWYWKAYYRRAGKLCSTYLGKSERLSLERLQEVAGALEDAGAGRDDLAVPTVGANPLAANSSPSGNRVLLETQVAWQQGGDAGHSLPTTASVADQLSLDDLPLPPNPMIGREQEVQAISDLLQCPEVRLLTLTGTAGVGKTRLALAAAAALRANFADGVCFVPL